jgi:3,4-dihydroxy 2-butanone 4-phosphate synthase/GTP cyclohydrolase II
MRQVFDSVSSAISAFKSGVPLIIVDTSPDRFHGAFSIAARHLTAKTLNMFLDEGRSPVALALDQSICLKFGFRPQVSNRTDGKVFATPFNFVDNGRETGQTSADRVKAIHAVVNPTTDPMSIRMPGYNQTIITTEKGVLSSRNLACAATDIARLSELEPAAVIGEILNNGGDLATLNELVDLAERHDLRIITLEELVDYRSHQ